MLKFVQFFCRGLLMIALGPVWSWGEEDFETLRGKTFEAVWEQVRVSYYDGSFGGKDWKEIGDEYRVRIQSAKTMPEARAVISAMLYELGESHLSLLSSDYSDTELASPWGGGWAGVALCYRGKDLVFYRLEPEGAAYRAGLRDGDILLKVNGRSTGKLRGLIKRTGLPEHTVDFNVLSATLTRFRRSPGEVLELRVRKPDGRKRSIDLELGSYHGSMTTPLGHLGQMPLMFDKELRPDGIAYVSFNLWFPVIMADLRSWIASLPEETTGLVIDLRGNPGGIMLVAGGLSGMLGEEQQELGRTTLREGHINLVAFPQRNAFLGKVAILVDEASVSTSEVFAVGLQEIGRAKVFGQKTPGAALPSVITSLPNGDYLQVAMGDFKTTKGTGLEGRGVMPDQLVAISPIELSEGIDRVLESACDWIKSSEPNPL